MTTDERLNALEIAISELRAEAAARADLHQDLLKGMAQLQQLLATFHDRVAVPGPRRVGTEDLLETLQKDRTRVRQIAEQLDELTGFVIRIAETQGGTKHLLELLGEFLRNLRGGQAA